MPYHSSKELLAAAEFSKNWRAFIKRNSLNRSRLIHWEIIIDVLDDALEEATKREETEAFREAEHQRYLRETRSGPDDNDVPDDQGYFAAKDPNR